LAAFDLISGISRQGSLATLAASTLVLSSFATSLEAAPQRKTFVEGSRWLVLTALTDELIHAETAAIGSPPTAMPLDATPMVYRRDWPGPSQYTVRRDGFATAALEVSVDPTSLCVSVSDTKRGYALTTTCPKDLTAPWKSLEFRTPGFQTFHGLGQYFDEPGQIDGDWAGRVWDPLFQGYGSQLRGFSGGANNFSMFPIVYGLGAAKRNFAVFIDNIYKQLWDFRTGASGVAESREGWRTSMWGDQLRWFVIAGDDLIALRRTYLEITGRPPVPPKRSFGLWVSEFGYTNWGEVLNELAALRNAGIPVDGFGMDLQWFGGSFGDPSRSRMGSLTWDTVNFPDPPDVIERLSREEGVRLMLIEEPYIASRLEEHRELSRRGALVRDCAGCAPTFLDYNPWWGYGGMLDFTSSSAAAFWHDWRRRPLTEMGIHDHWLDLGEPEQYNEWAWYAGFPEIGKHAQADVHNIYGTLWVESLAQGYKRNSTAARPSILSRTGTSGVQRHGAAIWSGDIGTNWNNLRSQLRVQTQMSLSGVDYYGSDVGGFQRQRAAIDGSVEELYTQWFANSAMFDVPLRPHAWNLDKQRSTSPAFRGSLESNRDNTRLRYELAPYYYSLAHAAARTGEPVFPPVFMHFQDDPNLRRTSNLKMIGPSLLVATVAQSGVSSRDVYLPRDNWINWDSRDWTSSNRDVIGGIPTWDKASFRLPMFARAGAIVPMMDVDARTMNIAGKRRDGSFRDVLRVRVFASQTPSTFVLAEDDNETTAWRSGAVRSTTINQRKTADGAIIVKIDDPIGTWPQAAARRPIRLELVVNAERVSGATLDGVQLEQCSALAESEASEAVSCWRNASRNLIVIETTSLPIAGTKLFDVKTTPVLQTHTVHFRCDNGTTTSGTSVYVSGDVPELGNSDPARAVKLDPTVYPTWTGTISGLPTGRQLNWRCLKRRERTAEVIAWQPGINAISLSGRDFAGLTSGAFAQ